MCLVTTNLAQLYEVLPRRAERRSALAIGAMVAWAAGGLAAPFLMWIDGWGWIIAVVVVAAAAVWRVLTIPPQVITARTVRKLKARAATGHAAAVVEGAVIAFGLSGMDVTTVVLETPVLNCGAFPVGKNAVVVWVTTGLVETLDRHELEAVLFAQISVGTEKHIVRAAVNETLIRTCVLPAFLLVLTCVYFAPWLFPLPFAAFLLIWQREHFTLARCKAADVVSARTTALPKALVSAYATIAERVTKERCRLGQPEFIDSFSLTATGHKNQGEASKWVNGEVVSTVTGETRALLRARSAYLRGLLSGDGGEMNLDALILTETQAEMAADQSRPANVSGTWYPDPYEPATGKLRLFQEGMWHAETRDEQWGPTQPENASTAQWHPDPFRFAPAMLRWWDGTRWTGHTHPPVLQSDAPDSAQNS